MASNDPDKISQIGSISNDFVDNISDLLPGASKGSLKQLARANIIRNPDALDKIDSAHVHLTKDGAYVTAVGVSADPPETAFGHVHGLAKDEKGFVKLTPEVASKVTAETQDGRVITGKQFYNAVNGKLKAPELDERSSKFLGKTNPKKYASLSDAEKEKIQQKFLDGRRDKATNPEGWVDPETRNYLIQNKMVTVNEKTGEAYLSTKGLERAKPSDGHAATLKAFQSHMGWMPAAGAVTGASVGALASASGGLSVFSALGGAVTGVGMGITGAMASAGAVASASGLGDGLAQRAERIMHSYARSAELDTLRNMIGSGISIEQLLMYFMAIMGNQMEEKLRDKMKEAALNAQRIEDRQRRQEQVDGLTGMASGALGMLGPAGMAASQGLSGLARLGVQKANQVDDAVNGRTKSDTIMMNEIQMIMQQWKQLMEMISNMSKSLHEMAMTPIRHLR